VTELPRYIGRHASPEAAAPQSDQTPQKDDESATEDPMPRLEFDPSATEETTVIKRSDLAQPGSPEETMSPPNPYQPTPDPIERWLDAPRSEAPITGSEPPPGPPGPRRLSQPPGPPPPPSPSTDRQPLEPSPDTSTEASGELPTPIRREPWAGPGTDPPPSDPPDDRDEPTVDEPSASEPWTGPAPDLPLRPRPVPDPTPESETTSDWLADADVDPDDDEDEAGPAPSADLEPEAASKSDVDLGSAPELDPDPTLESEVAAESEAAAESRSARGSATAWWTDPDPTDGPQPAPEPSAATDPEPVSDPEPVRSALATDDQESTVRPARSASRTSAPSSDLDSHGLARLTLLDAVHETWPGGTADLSAWLASNLELLEDPLGFGLTPRDTSPWEPRRAAAVAYDADRSSLDIPGNVVTADLAGAVVMLRAQVGEADTEGLGALLSAAAAAQARTAVWVCPRIDEGLRQALRWIGGDPSANVRLYGLEMYLVSIDGSPTAPLFDAVVSPGSP
jgi:hypothetical protein